MSETAFDWGFLSGFGGLFGGTAAVAGVWTAFRKFRTTESASLAETLRKEQGELRAELRAELKQQDTEIRSLRDELIETRNITYFMIAEILANDSTSLIARTAMKKLQALAGIGKLRNEMQAALAEASQERRATNSNLSELINQLQAEKDAKP